MVVKRCSKKWLNKIIPLLFFTAGILATIAYQDFRGQSQAIYEETYEETKVKGAYQEVSSPMEESPKSSPVTISQLEITQSVPNSLSQPSGKFTIVETGRITADKTQAETGVQVNFTVTLKNVGTKKKHLTHICFNHSGGVTFGCLPGRNLFPGEEFNINNSMIFPNPGSYSVWVTWSQDGTNFYWPVNGGTVSVQIE